MLIFAPMNKCVFLDRDGVINVDDPNYTYEISKFIIMPGVLDALRLFKENGFLIVICTNQSGIAKGIYTIGHVYKIHDYLQTQCNNAIDKFYFSPYHRSVSNSLLTKPEALMYEKGISKFDVDVTKSW